MGKFNNAGKKAKFTKESFAALKKKKIETARYKKHKMLQKYEKLLKSEGISSSNRVNLHLNREDVQGRLPASKEEKNKRLAISKKQPFAKELQIAAERKLVIEGKRQAAEQREGDIDGLRKERQAKADIYKKRVRQGHRGLGFSAVDLLAKIEKGKQLS